MATRNPAQVVPSINPKYACFSLRIAPSDIHRWGVFTDEFIPRGKRILEYTGERISRKETKRRSEESAINYLFTLDSYWTLDGGVGGSGAQFINHCCQPNCYAYNTGKRILYRAERDIQPGEELTIDYRFEHNVEKVPCGCGSTACRGTINLKRERKKHQSPRIVKKRKVVDS